MYGAVPAAVPAAVPGPGEVTRAEERRSELYWDRMKMDASQNSLSLAAAMEDLEDPVLVRNRFSLTLQLQKRQTPLGDFVSLYRSGKKAQCKFTKTQGLSKALNFVFFLESLGGCASCSGPGLGGSPASLSTVSGFPNVLPMKC